MTRNSMMRDCWISTSNPYVKYEEYWRKHIEEEEKNKMRFATAQVKKLMNDVDNFAKYYGLTAETEYDTSKPNLVYIKFTNNRISKSYAIESGFDSQVRERLNKVFADVVNYWKFNEFKPKRTNPIVPNIKKVIFSNPCTIVLWDDGTKTVVRCTNEEFDPEKGLAMAIAKKTLGNNGSYFDVFKKWIKEEHND